MVKRRSRRSEQSVAVEERPRGRLRSLPWLRIAAGALLALVLVALIPPLRNVVARGTSRVILFIASPLAPDIGGFDRLAASSRIVATDGSVLTELGEGERRKPVELSQLPPHVAEAVLAAEDENFYEHSGVDPTGVFRAFVRNAQGAEVQGGSTLTQQLAKLNYTARERTFARKLREVLYASELEKKHSKPELLERYLNQVYFGESAYGIAAAADAFFGKAPFDLTIADAAVLAGKIRSPEGLDPRKEPDQMVERRDQVLRNMREEGFITDQELEAAVAAPLQLAAPKPLDNNAIAPHFVEFVKREASGIDALGGSPEGRAKQLFTGGYTVETTLDRKIFDDTVKAVQSTLGAPGDPTTAVVSVVPGDGAIRSLFGGLDFASTQFDVASLDRRQPGSAFKPFVYLTALREGIDPRTTFDGTSPRTIPCYGKEVRNYAGEDAGGQIPLDEALEKSVNTVFVDVGCQVGTRDVYNTAVDAHIPPDATKVQGGIFLGGLDEGVSALTMAASYATFAAKGVFAAPYSITSIKDREGRVVYTRKPLTEKVFEEPEVGILNVPLQGVVQRGTGTAAAIGRPVAGKTGTTQDNVDAWFTGFTPQLSTAVWVGRNDRKPMDPIRGRAVTGGSYPSMVFSKMMKAALAGVPVRPIPTASPDALDLKILSTTTTSSTTSSSTTTSSTSSSLPPSTTTSSSTTSTSTTSTTSTTQPETQESSTNETTTTTSRKGR